MTTLDGTGPTPFNEVDDRDDGLTDRAARELADAIQVAEVHVEQTGMCRGCLILWARLSWWPCVQARWAQLVLDHTRLLDTRAIGDGMAQLSPRWRPGTRGRAGSHPSPQERPAVTSRSGDA